MDIFKKESEYKNLDQVGKVSIMKGRDRFVAWADWRTGIVAEGDTISEVLMEVSKSIKVLDEYFKNKN